MERGYRHLSRIVEAGGDDLRPLTGCLGGLIENLNVISYLPGEQQHSCVCSTWKRPVHSGERGRPRLAIGRDQLVFLLDHDFTVTAICDLLGVSRSTLHRRLREYGIDLQVCERFSRISDAELDRLVTEVKRDFSDAGYRLVQGHLRSRGHNIQQHKVISAPTRVDPEGVAERWAS